MFLRESSRPQAAHAGQSRRQTASSALEIEFEMRKMQNVERAMSERASASPGGTALARLQRRARLGWCATTLDAARARLEVESARAVADRLLHSAVRCSASKSARPTRRRSSRRSSATAMAAGARRRREGAGARVDAGTRFAPIGRLESARGVEPGHRHVQPASRRRRARGSSSTRRGAVAGGGASTLAILVRGRCTSSTRTPRTTDATADGARSPRCTQPGLDGDA